MKKIINLTIILLLTYSNFIHAGVIVGGTRIIYDDSKKESSLSVTNTDNNPYLIQAWIESTDAVKPPFIITPPLFKLNEKQQNILRIAYIGTDLPTDRESMFWINIKAIPSSQHSDKNTLQIAVKTRIKLIYRPKQLKENPEKESNKLIWKRVGTELQITNPSAFYMNFHDVTINGKKIKEINYMAPNSTKTFLLPDNYSNTVSWSLINDYGGRGIVHQNSF
ncbi:fimbrial biogenesis chaperone [Morganella morganii]|uniref:fimbrial biogenesis chaperone n=1 Tax=Morganella morganii TaxID=582 RepID=UPI000469B053|nr:molecular chaperone [Morganella morganii]